jgi:hypothetical protein
VEYYLLSHAQRIPQCRKTRRNSATPSGVIVVHTAENVADASGVDAGAEAVARYITTRGSYGSYHDLVDSDTIVPMAPTSYETWHETRTNNHAVGISAAVRTVDWERLPDDRVERVYRNLAKAAVRRMRDIEKGWGVKVPTKHISRSDALNRRPGFIGHGEIDTGRRSDPGADFDWSRFLRYVDQEAGRADSAPSRDDDREPKGPTLLKVDGVWGTAVTRSEQQRLDAPYVDGEISRQNEYWEQTGDYDGLGAGWEWIDRDRAVAGKGSQTIRLDQKGLKDRGHYKGDPDGLVGPEYFKAKQLALKDEGWYDGAIDGEIWRPSSTVKAMQRKENARRKAAWERKHG